MVAVPGKGTEMAKFDPKLIPLGIPWCREEDYPAFRAMVEDADDWLPSWETFTARAQEAERSFKSGSQAATCVHCNPTMLAKWCLDKGHRVNRDSCQKFASEIAFKQYINSGGFR